METSKWVRNCAEFQFLKVVALNDKRKAKKTGGNKDINEGRLKRDCLS